MGFLNVILGIVGDGLKTILPSIFPNPEDQLKREQLTQQLQMAIIAQASAIELAAADIVKTEAASQHFLAANWRPITMLTFTALIVCRWFGWSAPNLSETEYNHLWDIVQLGIGGYVIGRSVEKIVPSVTDAIRRK